MKQKDRYKSKDEESTYEVDRESVSKETAKLTESLESILQNPESCPDELLEKGSLEQTLEHLTRKIASNTKMIPSQRRHRFSGVRCNAKDFVYLTQMRNFCTGLLELLYLREGDYGKSQLLSPNWEDISKGEATTKRSITETLKLTNHGGYYGGGSVDITPFSRKIRQLLSPVSRQVLNFSGFATSSMIAPIIGVRLSDNDSHSAKDIDISFHPKSEEALRAVYLRLKKRGFNREMKDLLDE